MSMYFNPLKIKKLRAFYKKYYKYYYIILFTYINCIYNSHIYGKLQNFGEWLLKCQIAKISHYHVYMFIIYIHYTNVHLQQCTCTL